MSSEFGGAVWIGSAHPFDLHEVYLDFRSPVVQGKTGDVVEVLVSADSRYRLWLNGQFINRGPSRSYPHAQSFDRLDLSAAWRNGNNVLAVQVYQPGYSHFSYVHRAAAGMLATLSINGERRLVSDAGWRVRRNRSFASEVPRVSIYGSGVEVHNLELDDAWQQVKFDASEWDAARVVAEANGHIWAGLRERETPLLIEREIDAELIACRIAEDNLLFEEPHWSVRDAWIGGESIELVADAEGWFRPVPSLTFDTTLLFLFDLGRAYTCHGGAEIRGASGGEIINISYADKMVNGELVISDPETYCRVRLTDSFALRSGKQTLAPFTMRGGRYVLFQLAGGLGANFAFRPSVTVAEYPLKITKPLVTSDPQLAAITSMCETTMHACLQDSFVDCVWRESSQWLGDGYVQSLTLAAMCDDFRPMYKLLLDTSFGKHDFDYMLPSIAPGEVQAYIIPRYACMYIEALAFYIEHTGDVGIAKGSVIFERHIRTSLAFAAFLTHITRSGVGRTDGLHVTPHGLRHYIDWSATSQNDPHAVYNLHIVLALQKAASILELVKPENAEDKRIAAEELGQRCRDAFYDNGVWWDDLERTTFSQLAAAMALLAGAVEPDEEAALLDTIVARSLDPSDDHEPSKMVLASPFMHHYLFEALGKFGRNQSIIDIIKLRWGRWADAGEPTTWENWNIDFPDGSACHAFSAHPRYHLEKAIRSQVTGYSE